MRNIYLVVFGIFVVLLGGVSFFFISRPKHLALELRSSVAGMDLKWKDRAILEQIFWEQLQRARTNDALHPDTKQKIEKVRKVVISLVSYQLPLLITYAGTVDTGEHIASGDIGFSNDTLRLYIYFKPVERARRTPDVVAYIERITDALFTEKIIKLFLLAVPPPLPSVTPENYLVGFEQPKTSYTPGAWSTNEVYDDIMKRYIRKDIKDTKNIQYPLHLVGAIQKEKR